MVNSTQLSKFSVIDLLIGNTFYDLSFGIYNGNIELSGAQFGLKSYA